jgi:hypothetical protein
MLAWLVYGSQAEPGAGIGGEDRRIGDNPLLLSSGHPYLLPMVTSGRSPSADWR